MGNEQKTLTLGSLFDGSGTFPLGGLMAGIQPVWSSDVEPFPIRVTTKRMPFIKHYGDIGQMNGGEIEPVDIITFGSPCTSLSIAGLRAGLHGKQSVLFFEAVRIIKEMRCATDGRYPRFIVWENVTGAFSSSGGRDFQSVLTEIVRIKEPQAPEVPMPEKNWLPPTFLWETDGALLTGFLTARAGEFHSGGAVSILSQILEADVPQKYYLTPRACLGILRRASARGKELPTVLRLALERQAGL